MITQTPSGFTCTMSGDGTNDPFVLNLSKSPFDIKLTTVPSDISVTVTNLETNPTATGAISSNEAGDLLVTVALADALPDTSGPLDMEDVAYSGLSVIFIYGT